MPTISDIPTASALQSQLDTLHRAIAALDVNGTVIPNMVVMPGADTNAPPGAFLMSIGITLDPPISDAATLAQFKVALQAQADSVQQQLVNMGYTDDTGMMTRQGPAPRPEARHETEVRPAVPRIEYPETEVRPAVPRIEYPEHEDMEPAA